MAPVFHLRCGRSCSTRFSRPSLPVKDWAGLSISHDIIVKQHGGSIEVDTQPGEFTDSHRFAACGSVRKVKINGSRSLNWRELAKCFLRFGLAVPTVVTMSWPSSAAPPSDIAANAPERTVKFRDGVVVPALGQGSARLGQGRHPEAVEEEALRQGISLGMTLIDTAEIYGNGDAEKLIGHVIAGQRERVFLVSKVWPTHVGGAEFKEPVRQALPALGLTISTFICCIGQTGLQSVRRGSRLWGFAFAWQDPRLGRLQFQCQRYGKALTCAAWRRLRH